MGTTDPLPPPAAQGSEGSRLDGWKEIAVYLNRHVTTVRRWEKTESLPVHRHLHDKLGSVYAFRGELDAWWRSRRALLESTLDAGPSEDDDAAAEPNAGEPVAPSATLPSAGDAGGRTWVDAGADARALPDGTAARAATAAVLRRTRRRVLAGALMLVVATAAYAVSRAGLATRAEIRSLAVLPLHNLSGESADDHFADGMTDALITSLAQIQALRVISRTSVMRFKGTAKPLPEIARELGAEAVIEGSVQRSGNRVKITMQLVDGASDHHLWAREYERDVADVLKLQGELARAVADEIRARLTPEERARLASAQIVDPAAHEAYLLGRYHAWKMNEDDLRLATSHFERAVQIDPQYAAAYADLSLAWQYRSVFGATPYNESETPARSAAQMALALDRNAAAAHLARGHLKYAYELDFAGSEADLRRALDLEPHSVDAHYYYAKLLQSLGRLPEAIRHMERARELDPLSSSVASFFGKTLYNAEKYEEAIPHLKRAIELEPRNILAHTRLVENYEELGRYDEVLAYLAQEYERGGHPFYLLRKARLQARMGKQHEARRTLEHVNPSGSHPVDVATIYAALGDHDEAFRWLARAIDTGPSGPLLFVKVHPPLAPLRSDQRWGDVLGRMNLAD